jgi:hypothetical protein
MQLTSECQRVGPPPRLNVVLFGRSALTPYQYSYSRLAAETGLPPVRAMALQFPDDLSVYRRLRRRAMMLMIGTTLVWLRFAYALRCRCYA